MFSLKLFQDMVTPDFIPLLKENCSVSYLVIYFWTKSPKLHSANKLWVLFPPYHDVSSFDSMRKTLYSGNSRVAPIVKLAKGDKNPLWEFSGAVGNFFCFPKTINIISHFTQTLEMNQGEKFETQFQIWAGHLEWCDFIRNGKS